MVLRESFVLTSFITIALLMNLRGFTSYPEEERTKRANYSGISLRQYKAIFVLRSEWLIYFAFYFYRSKCRSRLVVIERIRIMCVKPKCVLL